MFVLHTKSQSRCGMNSRPVLTQRLSTSKPAKISGGKVTTQSLILISPPMCIPVTSFPLCLPVVVPRRPGRGIRLRTRILDRYTIESIHALLLHRHAVQIALGPTSGSGSQSKCLARCAHTLLLLHQSELALLALLAAEHQPPAVNRPVPQVTVTRHAQRGRETAGRERREGLEEVDDLGVLRVASALVGAPAFVGLASGLLDLGLLVLGLGLVSGGGGEVGCCGEASGRRRELGGEVHGRAGEREETGGEASEIEREGHLV